MPSEIHLSNWTSLPFMNSVFFPSDTIWFYCGLHEFWILLQVQVLSKNLPEIGIVLSQPYFYVRLCLLKLSKWWEGRTESIFGGVEGDVHKQCGDTMQTRELVFHATLAERQLLYTVLYNNLPSLSAPHRWVESQKERLSTAVFVRGREGVSAWGLPACPAWACPCCQPGPSLPLGTAGTHVLNQRPIYPSPTPQTKWFLLVFCRLSVPGS